MKQSFAASLAFVVLFSGTAVLAAGDPARGAAAFQLCASCHSMEPGRHLTGPSLAHVWGRKAGTAQGFNRYSDALQRSGIVWNEQTLDNWLANPQAAVPGNSMPFAGIQDAKVRADVVAFLRASSEGKAPAPARGGMGGMMGGGMRGMMGGMMGDAGPANLRQADSASQVASLHHCHDTYTVRTASGAAHKIWEYNLRLKTDSSDHGPTPGKPVLTGSGMQGDRFSIVFSTPAEISKFVKESCD